MAYEKPGYTYSQMSVGDIVQFTGVQIQAGGGVATSKAGEAIDGVAQMPAAAASPEMIRVMKSGITFGIAGDAVAIGEAVEVDNQGRFIPLNQGVQVGKALSAAGAAGKELSILL